MTLIQLNTPIHNPDSPDHSPSSQSRPLISAVAPCLLRMIHGSHLCLQSMNLERSHVMPYHAVIQSKNTAGELCGSRVVVDSKGREAVRFSSHGPINAGKAPIDTAPLCRRWRLLSRLFSILQAPLEAPLGAAGRLCERSRLLSMLAPFSVATQETALRRRDSNSSP